jgi:tetratricopeptide (TPR) repeat protein
MPDSFLDTESGRLQVTLRGPFAVSAPDGTDMTPLGRRSQAVFAILALTPDHRRTRSWIQNRLWNRRGKEQAAASLRQALTDIRRALGPHREILKADSQTIELDGSCLDLDVNRSDANALAGELLEGMDLGDNELGDWIAAQRRSWLDRPKLIEPPAETPEISTDTNLLLLRSDVRDSSQPAWTMLADCLADSVARSVRELGSADVIDERGLAEQLTRKGRNTLTLSVNAALFGESRMVRLVLSSLPQHGHLWSSTLVRPADAEPDIADTEMLRAINQATMAALAEFSQQQKRDGRRIAAELCQNGIFHLFRLGTENFIAADRLFAEAFEMEERGIYLAWRAYLRTFLLAERQFGCRETLNDEAFDFLARALALDPQNSYVAALASHVHALMRRSYAAAFELAERAVQLNPANPIGWACLGNSKCYLGRTEEGFRDTVRARELAGTAPFRYQMDAISCVAGTMAGEFGRAIHMGESSHALAPYFAPPLRYLAALYAEAGMMERSHEMVVKLRRAEPDFSYDSLRDKAYPAAGLHRTPILKSLPARSL